MKYVKSMLLAVLLAVSLISSALAAEVPDDLTVENLNGQQRIVKTYVLSPDVDPATLKENPFDYDGFHYVWAFTTKEETPYLESKLASETVTVETSSKDLSVILEALKPTIPYDDGEFTGELALDHTTLSTVVSSYTTKYGTVTDTKVIGDLDRNDMSYVPATTVKNGSTLSLKNVEWQVTGTDLVGDTLMPCSYQAVATYSASYSYQSATGYVTTAEYHGEVTAEGIDHITYTVIYVGEEIVPPAPEPEANSGGSILPAVKKALPAALALLIALLLAAGGIALLRRRRNVSVYVPGEEEGDYVLTGKYKVDAQNTDIDLCGLSPYPERMVAVELKRSAARKLAGKEVRVICRAGTFEHTVPQGAKDDWFTFDVETLQSETQ